MLRPRMIIYFSALMISGFHSVELAAQTQQIPPLSPIEVDDDVPAIAELRGLYARLTAADWRPMTVVKANASAGKVPQYPKGEQFCKQLAGGGELIFQTSGKSPVARMNYARVESAMCLPGKAKVSRVQGIFRFDDNSMIVGTVDFTNKRFAKSVRLEQASDRVVRAYRPAAATGTELAAVAVPSGVTLVATAPGRLFGIRYYRSIYQVERWPANALPSRMIIPGVGYFDGRIGGSTSMQGADFNFGAVTDFVPGYGPAPKGYTQFIAHDDSFRITGPIYAYYERPAAPLLSHHNYFPEHLIPKALRFSYATMVGEMNGKRDADTDDIAAYINVQLVMASTTWQGSCSRETCGNILIETRTTTDLGPPGSYLYVGVIDFSKAPNLAAMMDPNRSRIRPSPQTYMNALRAGEISKSAYANDEEAARAQGRVDAHFAKLLSLREARWVSAEKYERDFNAMVTEQHRQDVAYQREKRRQDNARAAATHAAIIGALNDVGASFQQGSQDMAASRSAVGQGNTAASSGAAQPRVMQPINEEARRLLAANWGRNRGRFPSDAGRSGGAEPRLETRAGADNANASGNGSLTSASGASVDSQSGGSRSRDDGPSESASGARQQPDQDRQDGQDQIARDYLETPEAVAVCRILSINGQFRCHSSLALAGVAVNTQQTAGWRTPDEWVAHVGNCGERGDKLALPDGSVYWTCGYGVGGIAGDAAKAAGIVLDRGIFYCRREESYCKRTERP